MSKRGFVRGARQAPPNVPPVRIAVAAPLALPEREPRNILLMITIPALLVGIIGTLMFRRALGTRSPHQLGRTGKTTPRLSTPARRGPRRSATRGT